MKSATISHRAPSTTTHFGFEALCFQATGRAITETLCPTDVHKLYSVERGWVMTKHLRVGEVLRTQGATALERGSTLVTSDKSLCIAVNTLGGKAIRK